MLALAHCSYAFWSNKLCGFMGFLSCIIWTLEKCSFSNYFKSKQISSFSLHLVYSLL